MNNRIKFRTLKDCVEVADFLFGFLNWKWADRKGNLYIPHKYMIKRTLKSLRKNLGMVVSCCVSTGRLEVSREDGRLFYSIIPEYNQYRVGGIVAKKRDFAGGYCCFQELF